MKPTRKAMRLVLALALPACSIGCASNRQPVAVVRVPPPERLTCKAEPAVPAIATDATVAGYIVELAGAGQNCRSAMAWIKDWAEAVRHP